jgi:predicted ATP-binding protein involved in virulence
MPLEPGKSRAAFSNNVAAEVQAGKPQQQAAAIAYSKRREADMAKDYQQAQSGLTLSRLNQQNQDANKAVASEDTIDYWSIEKTIGGGIRILKEEKGPIGKGSDTGKWAVEWRGKRREFSSESEAKDFAKAMEEKIQSLEDRYE